MNDNNIILKVEHLTKMFGIKKSAAREMLKKGMSKEEILKQTEDTVAVDDVSFEVERGKIFALIGLSGSGKSTVVRCLNMLQPPNSGKIYFEGNDIEKYSKDELRNYRRHKISMVFPDSHLKFLLND